MTSGVTQHTKSKGTKKSSNPLFLLTDTKIPKIARKRDKKRLH